MSEGTRLRHEIPTHLEVEDRILFGLTLRQGVLLLLGVTAGYLVYSQSGHLPWPGSSLDVVDARLPLALRIMLGLFPALCALLLAVLQPAGRAPEDWLFAIARYATLPKRCVWHPRRVLEHLQPSAEELPDELRAQGRPEEATDPAEIA